MNLGKKMIFIAPIFFLCILLGVKIPTVVSIAVILGMLIIVGIDDRFKLFSKGNDLKGD